MNLFKRNLLFFSGTLLLFFTELSYFMPGFPLWNFKWLPGSYISGGLLLVWGTFYLWKSGALRLQFSDSRKEDIRMFLLILPLHMLVHYQDMLHSFWRLNADNNLPCLVARTISEEGIRQIYWFNQTYQGVLQSHLYALFNHIFRDLNISVFFVNSILFSLAVLVACKLTYKLFGYRWLTVVLMLAPTGVMSYLGSTDAKGYPLIVLLLVLLLYNAYGYTFESRGVRALFWAALSGGVLFAQYQPALLLIAGIIFPLLILALYRKDYIAAPLVGGGFITGSLPHLMAEVYTGFINFRHMFLANSGSVTEKIADVGAYWDMFIFFPLALDGTLFLKVFFGSLFLIGMVVFFYRFVKSREWKYVYLPAVYLFICFFAMLSGRSPEINRYAMHFYVYAPVAVLIMSASLNALGRVAGKKTFIAVTVIITAVLSLYRFTDQYELIKNRHLGAESDIELVKNSSSDVLVGEYWNAMRFQSVVTDKLFLTRTIFPGKFLAFCGISPGHVMKTASGDNPETGVLLKNERRKRWFENYLNKKDFKYTKSASGTLAIYENITPPLPLEQAFNAVILSDKKAVTKISPWDHIKDRVTVRGREILLSYEGEYINEWKKYSLLLRNQHGDCGVKFPLIASGGKIRAVIPDNVMMKSGVYSGEYYLEGTTVRRSDFVLETDSHNGAVYISGLTDIVSIIGVSNNLENMIRDESRSKFMFGLMEVGEGFKHMCDHFLGIKNYLVIAGLPVNRKIGLSFTDGTGERLIRMEVFSLPDFNSMKWGKRYVQNLIIEAGKERMSIDLKPGFNIVEFKVSSESFSIDTKYRSWFYGANSAGEYSYYRCGAVINSLKLSYKGKLIDIKPYMKKVV